MLLSEGQMSDYKGAALMLPAMPKARELLADEATTPIGSGRPGKARRRRLHPLEIQSEGRDPP
jgi:hypothetical protein